MHFNCCLFPRNESIPVSFVVLLCAGLSLISTCATALADDFNVVPSLGVRAEYDDNLFYTADKTGDFRAIFTPGIGVQEKTERLDATLLVNLSGIKYADKKQFDTVDYGAYGNLSYQYTPRLNIAVNAQYVRNSTANREVSAAAIILDTVRCYQQHYSLQAGYALNERTSVTASYAYAQFDYVTVSAPSVQSGLQPLPPPPGPPNVTPPPSPPPVTITPPAQGNNDPLTTPNVAVHSPSLSLVRKFNELTQGSLNTGYTRYSYEFSTIDNYEATLTLNRSLNELWSVSVTGGGRFTHSEFTSNNLQETDDNWGWVGQCALNYNGLYATGSLSLLRDITAGGSTANERTAVILDTHYRFTEEFSGSFSAGYSLFSANRGEFAGTATDDDSLQFSAGLRYDFTKDISLDGGYLKVIATTGGVDIDKNYAFLNLTIRCPIFR
jgi:predicted porin